MPSFYSASRVFGLLSGIAATIKPTTLPSPSRSHHPYALPHFRASPSMPTPPFRKHAIASSRRQSRHPRRPSHRARLPVPRTRPRRLPRRLHCLSPITPASDTARSASSCCIASLPLLPLVLPWLAVLVAPGPAAPSAPPRHSIAPCSPPASSSALVDCILQHRAFPYYRYPLLAFLLPLIALDLDRALRPQAAAFATLSVRNQRPSSRLPPSAFGGFFLAPSIRDPHPSLSAGGNTEFITSLQKNLKPSAAPPLGPHPMHRRHRRLLQRPLPACASSNPPACSPTTSSSAPPDRPSPSSARPAPTFLPPSLPILPKSSWSPAPPHRRPRQLREARPLARFRRLPRHPLHPPHRMVPHPHRSLVEPQRNPRQLPHLRAAMKLIAHTSSLTAQSQKRLNLEPRT